MAIRKTWLRLGLIVATLLIIGSGGLLGYRFYKAEHQKKILANARSALAIGPSAAALLWVTEALKGNPNGVEENRLMADLVDAAKSPSVRQWRIRVVRLEPGNVRNYLAWANSELELGAPDKALAALRKAPVSAKEDFEWQNLNEAAAAACGLIAEAQTHFEEAARLKPQDSLAQVNLHTFELFLPGKSEAARDWLRQQVKDPVTGLQVQRALLQDALRRNLPGDAEIVKSAIEQNPRSEIGDRVNCLEIDYRKDPHTGSLNLLQKWVQGRPETAPPLIYWMLGHGFGREAIAWIESSFPEKSRSIPIQIAEADCISTLADWPLLTRSIANTNWRGLDFVRQAMLIRARKQSANAEWNVAWRALVRNLSSDDQSLLVLGRLSQAWGWSGEASDLYWQLVDRLSSQKNEALARLTQMYRVEQDTSGLFRVAQAQLAAAPDNLEFRNHFACLALLLGLQTEKATRIAVENAKMVPNDPDVVATYSFARLSEGKAEEARKILEALSQETLAKPNISPYYAAVLLAEHDSVSGLKSARSALTSKEMLPQGESNRVLFATGPGH